MKSISIYVNRADVKTVEEEERLAFVRRTLEAIGLELDEVWPEDQPPTSAKSKIELRRFLKPFDVDILEDGDRGLKIYVDKDVIAEWIKPKCILRFDPSGRRIDDKFYYELIIQFWSMYEEGEEQNEA